MWKVALFSVAMHSALAHAVEGEVALSPQDLAYVAAQEIQIGQDMVESLCGRTKFRKDVERRHAEFVAANPEFTTALKSKPTDRDAKARAKALLKRYQDGMNMLVSRASGMPPEMFCASTVQRERGDFTASVENLRTRVANPLPTAPPDPEAGLAEVRLSAEDLGEVVLQVLQNPDVAKYLHPESPDRLPVRVALADPYARERLDLAVFGHPVRTARLADTAAVQLSIRATDKTAKVTVAYAPEGIEGTIRLARERDAWRTVETKVYE